MTRIPARELRVPSKLDLDRERWLRRALKLLAPLLRPDTLPEIRVTVEKPGTRGAVGECWDDEVCRIVVSPTLVEETEVLAVLLHELLHACAGPEKLHNGPYRPLWRRVGFQGLPKGYDVSEGLLDVLEAIAVRLGRYPQ